MLSLFVRLGCLHLMVAIGAGAFGAHALRSFVTVDRLAVWNTGVLYHVIHGIACIALVGCAPFFHPQRLRVGLWMMQLGIVLFSGSLYLLCLLDIARIGIITPMGGMSLLIAWAILFSAVRTSPAK